MGMGRVGRRGRALMETVKSAVVGGRASGDGRRRRGAPALIGQVATGKYDACGV